MTNVIVDAGIDAKVAKFMKRGLEVIRLAVLEPVELCGSLTYEETSQLLAGTFGSKQIQLRGLWTARINILDAKSMHPRWDSNPQPSD